MNRKLLLSFCLLFVVGLSGCAGLKPSLKASPTLANALGVADIPLKELKKQYADKDSRFMEVDDLQIHYRDVGEGPTIVLLHGIMSSLHTWEGWIEELRKNYRVIALDLPGYGLTGGPEDADDFDEDYVYTRFSKFIRRLELTRFSLAGNSFGGYLSARYAAEHPEQVEKLILVDPVGYPQEHTPKVFDLATMPVVGTLANYVQPPFLVTRNVEQVYGDPKRISQDNLYRYVHMSQRPGARKIYVRTMRIMKEAAAEQRNLPFADIRSPTLLMWGEADRWVPIKLAERWRGDVRNIKFISYPDVGHVPMEEIAYQTVQDAIVFLSDLQQAPTRSEPSIEELESILQGDGGFEPMEGI
ncbi:predicted Hydrolase or acyltransferase (alpha/beta hydrolase superfamily) [Hahella chejuensis KCTC 2396]|uniref:Predicted Hydrolase or acyltransferase (Alpha/beta hydrolase superfamily) n=1 Tax=Hahella chejuensis (strain KCTC 2396) TaxID=349521 RepID=Q2SJ56_HAHCH|nr:alpha/beta hydrolase [Hahella chejuensis]ABC29318.1 predicted Hydrolase or acyltransferase (alpha/beta hydrolase superfamily) [Hahella chejuensis KCTC 2396]